MKKQIIADYPEVSQKLFDIIAKGKELELSLLNFLEVESLRSVEEEYDELPYDEETFLPFSDYVAIAWLAYPYLLVEKEPLYCIMLPTGQKFIKHNNDYVFANDVNSIDGASVIQQTKGWYKDNGYQWAEKYMVEASE